MAEHSVDLLDICKASINLMLARAQTKVIQSIITLGLLTEYKRTGIQVFSNQQVKSAYEDAVASMKNYLQHDMHIGGKYDDAYADRLRKYGVTRLLDDMKFELLPPFLECAEALIDWIPERIKQFIEVRLGLIPMLQNRQSRADLSASEESFLQLVEDHITKNPTNFEIFGFAVIKIHLEKFACKVYRDTRTSAIDKGVDLSTNFGVVYQVKKLNVYTRSVADNLYAELKRNFDSERLTDGNVILVIDDISQEIKQYLINMKVQSISKKDILRLARQFEDVEDREKILRIVYEEFRREYSSSIQ